MQAFLVLVLLLRVASSLNDDGFALLSFKQSISEDPQSSLSNWNDSDQNPCSWNGVTCKDQRVVSLSVPKKKLYGLIPSSLGSISSLRHLNLRSNRLYGRLPSDLFHAKGLQSLVLFGNSLSGSLPKELGDLNFLQSLDLSGNFFNGSLPDSILNCKRLKTLDLSQNNFTGSLPRNFGSAFMGSLEKLDLSFNVFSGSIPNDIGNLSSLQGTVDFSHNTFSGSIPAGLGNLPEKVYIDLTHNNLSGPIPQTGALMNRGPTAFLGNPGLCGPPLKDPCSTQESPFPYLPDSNSSTDPRSSPGLSRNGKSKGLSKSVLIAIVVSDAIGICLVGLLFSYCYSRIRSCKDRNENSHKKWNKSNKKKKKKKKECLCLGKEDSEALSENNNNTVEQYDLVALDGQLGFDLDELLKASAFVLGKSGIGIVYKVVLEDGLTLAVRRLGEGGSQRFREFRTEVEAIGKLKHPNVATLRAYYWSVDEKLLIYDYIPNGNLSSAIHGKPGTVPFEPLSWATRLNVMKGIARGVLYLHEFSPKKYVHGDLKPNNILLDHNMRPHISDFGLARLATIAGAGSPVSGSDRAATDKPPHHHHDGAGPTIVPSAGPGCYVAPEAVKMVKPSQKWDVYSYGAVLLELVTGRSPVVQVGPAEEVDLVRWIRICVDEKKPLSEVLDPHLAREAEDNDNDDEIVAVIKIAMACVQTSPEKRPTMRHVCEALERLTNVSDV